MRSVFAAFLFLAASILEAQTQPPLQQSEGVRPRAQANEYATQVQNSQGTFAASAIPAQQVKQRFAYDISKTYVVIEVACYPPANGSVAVRDSDVTLRLSTKAESVYPAEPATVAAIMHRKNEPSAPGLSTPVYTEATVGYESGRDPYTGRRVNSVYTGAGVGVGNPQAGPYPYPGRDPIDRSLLEEQLWHRSLPQGLFSRPVAGYLYFPNELLKKEKGFYLLEILGEGSEKWQLRVPLPHS